MTDFVTNSSNEAVFGDRNTGGLSVSGGVWEGKDGSVSTLNSDNTEAPESRPLSTHILLSVCVCVCETDGVD